MFAVVNIGGILFASRIWWDVKDSCECSLESASNYLSHNRKQYFRGSIVCQYHDNFRRMHYRRSVSFEANANSIDWHSDDYRNVGKWTEESRQQICLCGLGHSEYKLDRSYFDDSFRNGMFSITNVWVWRLSSDSINTIAIIAVLEWSMSFWDTQNAKEGNSIHE